MQSWREQCKTSCSRCNEEFYAPTNILNLCPSCVRKDESSFTFTLILVFIFICLVMGLIAFNKIHDSSKIQIERSK